jgi:hypothetical protein
VFWTPTGTSLDSTVVTGMTQMETDIQTALANGQNTSIFVVPGQYSGSNGPGDPRISSIDTTLDADPIPANGSDQACQSVASSCATDTAVAQEVTALASRRGWAAGEHSLVLLVVAPQVIVCLDTGCTAAKEFCGYHSLSDRGQAYAVITMSGAAADCGGGYALPDFSYAAAPTGHEQNEAIVNPSGAGVEIADPCQGSFAWNSINGHEYQLPYLRLRSGVCSPVQTFTPTLDASFTTTQLALFTSA